MGIREEFAKAMQRRNQGAGEDFINIERPNEYTQGSDDLYLNAYNLGNKKAGSGESFISDIPAYVPNNITQDDGFFSQLLGKDFGKDFGFNKGTAEVFSGFANFLQGQKKNDLYQKEIDLGESQLAQNKDIFLKNYALATQNAERQRTTVNNQIGANRRDLAERRSPTDRTKRGGAENYAHLKLLT